ncbi:MAG: hypothetical protein EZS28_038039, partial [Streblomastix strix]
MNTKLDNRENKAKNLSKKENLEEKQIKNKIEEDLIDSDGTKKMRIDEEGNSIIVPKSKQQKQLLSPLISKEKEKEKTKSKRGRPRIKRDVVEDDENEEEDDDLLNISAKKR